MNLLRRLLGSADTDGGLARPFPDGPSTDAAVRLAPEPPPAALPCPSCAVLLSPPPVGDRRCPRCRQPIIVRRLEGRTVLLNEAAVEFFKAERRRAAEERVQSAARQRWLRLAHKVNASPNRCAKLAAAPVSSDVVAASRGLYLATVERAVKAARHDGRWGDIGRIRREQARALYDEAGAPVSPPDDIADLHREGMVAVLRSLQPLAREVELVSAKCCPTCRREDGQTFRIADEVRLRRLPHAGCPLGLCGCDWWPAMEQPGRAQARRRPRTSHPEGESSADSGRGSWAAAS